MELFASKTDFQPILTTGEKIEANCTSIIFQNNSSFEYDVNGNQVGYRLVINDLLELLPSQTIAFDQNTGYVDTTVYKVAFKAVALTPGGAIKAGVVGRINSVPPNCITHK